MKKRGVTLAILGLIVSIFTTGWTFLVSFFVFLFGLSISKINKMW